MRQLLIFILFLPLLTNGQSTEEILQKAISYHDSEGVWSMLVANFYYRETRPDLPDRKTVFKIDNSKGQWMLNRDDSEAYEVNGEEAVVVKGNKGKERGLMMRNYYLYLWGLPMKLMDESTPEITFVADEEVNGVSTDVLRVPYEAETYYFYFDKKTGRMLQYKFYKDEEAGKGELITLEGEVSGKGLKIPQSRSWYTLPEMKFLGTDILERID